MNLDDRQNFIRYLMVKKGVDDRSLNMRIWDRLKIRLSDMAGVGQEKMRILEVGGGIGVMLARMLEDELLPECDYCLLDSDLDSIAAASEYITAWAVENDFSVEKTGNNLFRISGPRGVVVLELVYEDFYQFTEKRPCPWDFILGHAVLDLFDLEVAVRRLERVIKPGGLLYLTVNYDGHTIFEPQINPDFEERLLWLYNQSMDDRKVNGVPSGDSRSGRHLFAVARRQGFKILSAGSSDWVVFSGSQGYPEGEAEFLKFIIEMIYRQMRAHPEVDEKMLKDWVAARRKQVESEDLVFIAHQIDFLLRKEG